MTDLHLYPINDVIEHDTGDRDCVCGPVLCGDLVVHQPLQPMIDGDDDEG